MSSYIYESRNTKSFYNMAWIAFTLSFAGMLIGVLYMDASVELKGFLVMSYFFSVTSCFTLAKVVRDKDESEKFINKVQTAKTERLLNENVV